MEVIDSNFDALLPQVKDAIDECQFMAIDTELTGLHNELKEHAFDTIADRYSKYRKSSMQFFIVQFGLSTFKFHPKQNKYTHQEFNFYVFQRPHTRKSPDPIFMCQSSSVQFLASQGFDFNKVFYNGIPYLNPSQEEKLKDVLKTKHKNEQEALGKSRQHTIDVPKDQEQFIAEVHKRIDCFLNDESKTEIQLDSCTPYQRKLIYDTVQQKYSTGIDMETVTTEDNKKGIHIVKTTEEEKFEKLNMKHKNDLDNLDAAVGFRRVLDHISQSRKLVVGHNILLDMMHTLDQFFHPIPQELDEFKEMLHMLFPLLMDTKLLASSKNLKEFFSSTQLSALAKTLQGRAFKMPSIEPSDGFKGYDLNSEKEHEAGYDAFLTGYSYIGLITKLGALSSVSPSTRYVEPDAEHLSPYLNKIYIMKHYDIGELKICAPDPEPDRSNVFHVGFPANWITLDLIDLFLPYGSIYISWLDSLSALIALKNRENINKAKSNLLNKHSQLYTVRSYSQYQEQILNKRTRSSARNDGPGNKRRTSGFSETMELIPEIDENEAERADDSEGPSKRQKCSHEENDTEVSSTAKVFEEENTW